VTVSPTSLSFNGATGQANPAAQTISVTSSGSALAYTTTVSTSKGGGWLAATQSGTTPGSISVSVNTSGLAADTYNGQVTIAIPGATNNSINVPITLVVAAPANLNVSPQSLSFTYQTGGSNPASQSLSITSSGGALNYSVASDSSWLTVSATSGTTPGTLNVSINPAGLSVGSVSGNLSISAPGATTVKVPVTLTISNASTLTVNPQSLTFTAPSGSNPTGQTITVNASGNANIAYTVAVTGSWLSATPSGTTPGSISVTVNSSTLSPGTYNGSVAISSTAASNSPQTVNVTLTVTSVPQIVPTPASLSFFVPGDGSTPAPQTITVISTSGNTNFTATAASQGGAWLSVSGGGQTPGNLQVSVNPANLLPGQTYNGAITINAPAANPTSVQVPVTITLASQGAVPLQVLPSAVYLNYTQGAGSALEHVTVFNNGGGNVTFSAQVKSATCGNWMTVLNPTGSANASTPGVVGFNVNPTGISSQTCRGSLSVTDSNGNVTTVPVYMAIGSLSQSLQLSQSAMSFSAVAGGTAPAAQTFQVLNPGSGTLQWTASTTVLSGNNWLSVTPNAGTAQSLAQPGGPVSVAVNPQGLAAGTYYGTVQVNATGANNGPQYISVTFTVAASGTNPPAQVVPGGVILTGTGGSSDTQTVQITNLGSSSLSYSSVAITDDGQAWLNATPSSGSIAAGATAAINMTGNLNGLGGGLRHGTLRLIFSDGTVQSVDVQFATAGSIGGTGVRPCSPTNLAMQFVTPAQNFSAPARVGVPVQVLVKDCSGNTLTGSTAGVDLISGDMDTHLTYIGNGMWSGTWTPAAASGVVNLTARAVAISGAGAATGVVTASGAANAAPAGGPPYVGAVLNAASYLLPGFVAPGTMVSIFGSGLANGQQSVFTTPFPTTLQGAKFTVRGVSMPLFYASDGQVNGIIPIGIPANERDQLIVVRDTTVSTPVDLLVADVDPGMFSTNQAGTGQGAILIAGTPQIAGPATPATVGQYLSIFLSGMGTVSNPPADGSPSTGDSLTTLTPTVTIGGTPATVSYSGLAPGNVGLYQVNVQIQQGTPTGDAVQVVVNLGNGISNTVTVAIK
jgi:uncharacterized protein (TIGR03437 family)